MSVIGFDLGNLFCYTACARAGGIETLANEYSARHTPTFVSFSGKQRFMGTASQQAVVTNLKNTFYNLKRFVGKSFDDPSVQAEREKFGPAGKMLRGEDGSILFETRYVDEVKTFTPEQLLAAMLSKLKENAEMALDGKIVSDCVISVPSYYTEQQRRKLLEASQMANLNSLKLMNETTAVALSYGIYKQDLPAPEEPPRHVVFVDFGQSSLQTSVVALHKGKLKMLASMSDSDIGGRDFDLRLAEKFAEDFVKKSKIDIRKNPRSFLRLVAECEKMKKTMSANATNIPINIECLVDEIDFSAKMKRDDFEVLCEDLVKKIEDVFVRLLADCGLTVDQIHSVEVVGGGSRIPAVKRLVGSVFGKEPSTTLNADEAVARGCALQCAILSPTFRVRDFSVEDCQNFSIDLVYQNADGTGEQRMEVFPRSSNVPSSKVLTFYRKEAFRLKAVYGVAAEETLNKLPLGHSTIGEYVVQDVVPTEEGEPSKVKVKVRVDLCGLFKMTQAQLIVRKEEVVAEAETEAEGKPAEKAAGDNEETQMNEEVTESAAVPDAAVPDAAAPAPTTEPEAPMDAEPTSGEASNNDADSNTLPTEPTPSETTHMDQSAPAANQEQQQQQSEEAPPEAPKKKAKIQTLSLTTQSMDSSMDKTVLSRFHELENEMISQDREERDRQVAKNTLEEYVIEMRRKCGEELERFVEPKQREDFVRNLDGVEDWLYEDGEDVLKSIYVAKQLELEKTGNPIVDRYRQCQARPKAFDDLELTVQRANAFVELWSAAFASEAAENGQVDEAIAHITKEDVGKMVDAVAKAVKWKTEKLEKQAKKSLTEAPAVTTSAIEDERKKLEKVVDSVVNKPKPKKKKEEKKDEEKENVDGKKEGKEEEKMEEQPEGEKENVDEQKGGKDDASEVIKEPKIDEKKTETGVNDPTNEMDLD